MGYPIPKELSPIWFILFVELWFYMDGGEGPGFEAGIESFFLLLFEFFLFDSLFLCIKAPNRPNRPSKDLD